MPWDEVDEAAPPGAGDASLGADGPTDPGPDRDDASAAGSGGEDDLFGPTPGLRRGLTAAGLVLIALAAAEALLVGASPLAGLAAALAGGLVWTVWRPRLSTGYRIGWLAWIVAVGVALAWAGRPTLLLPALAGLGLGALVPTVRAVRRPAAPGDRER